MWKESTLGMIVEPVGLIQTGPFGSQLHQSDYVSDGIPVIMPKDIDDGRIGTETVARVSEETAMRLCRHRLRPRSIVLPRRGEITKRAWIGNDQAGWLCGTGCLQIVVEGTDLVPEFLYYYMEQDHVVRWLEQHAVGTTMLNLSASIVAGLPVRYPTPYEQSRIAAILSAYDDLIANNRWRIQLLEEAARLLYREWFVCLRFPGHEHAKIRDGIPEGWKKVPLTELAEVNRASLGKNFQGEIEYIDISAVSPGHIEQTAIYEFSAAPSRARRVVQHGDIIWSCVRPNRRSHAVIWRPRENLIASTGFAAITPTVVPTSFLYQAVTTDQFVGLLVANARGVAYPAVTAPVFESTPILTPPRTLLDQYNELAEPMLEQISILRQQSQLLARARDLLLPRLMSGEVAV